MAKPAPATAARPKPAPKAKARPTSKPIDTEMVKMTKERDQFRNWYHEERAVARKRQGEINRLQSILRSLSSLALNATAAEPPYNLDDEIPF